MFDNKLWLSSKFTKAQAWVDLFANANHEPGVFWVRGNEVKIGRGQIGWSEITMTKRWKWSRDRVRRFLSWLESEQNIRQQKTAFTTIVTIVNYDQYQTNDTTDKTTKPSKQDSRQDSRQDTNKNDKNVKNDKNATPPQDVVEIIDAFKPVNPSFGKWYMNTTQRAAIERMLKIHGKDRLLKVIAFLPTSNTIPFVPTITTPYLLEEKWADLQAGLIKVKNKSSAAAPKVIL